MIMPISQMTEMKHRAVTPLVRRAAEMTPLFRKGLGLAMNTLSFCLVRPRDSSYVPQSGSRTAAVDGMRTQVWF